MLLVGILGSDYLYYRQNIVVPFLICNAVVLPYPEIDSILEISCVTALDSLKMYFGQTSHTV